MKFYAILCNNAAKHLVLPEAFSKDFKMLVILAFLKSLGRGPVRRCASHPEPKHHKILKP
jgi:hypothetical protein